MQDAQGLAVVGARHAVDDKARGGSGVNCGFAPGRGRGMQGMGHIGPSGQTRHHFHQGHERSRVKKVKSRHPLRVFQRRTDGRDGNRRGIAGQNAMGRHHHFQVGKQLVLDGQALHNGFDHQPGIGQVGQLMRHLQPRTGCLRLLGAELAFGRHLVELGTNACNRLRSRIGTGIQ